MSDINKKSLEHLAELAKIDISDSEAERLSGDLRNILEYFKELRELNTENAAPIAGGTQIKNTLREDAPFEKNHFVDAGRIHQEFPEKGEGHLQTPPVFE